MGQRRNPNKLVGTRVSSLTVRCGFPVTNPRSNGAHSGARSNWYFVGKLQLQSAEGASVYISSPSAIRTSTARSWSEVRPL